MRMISLTFAAILFAFGATAGASADEWEENTPYYEDDAWYDVTEWFDGNDYNPTDEEFLEWDDEIYQPDPDSPDVDNDNWYGYTDYDAADDWYYDYYDYGHDSYTGYDYEDNLYEAGFRYYDFDNDGINDAYVSYYDWDGDGLYEDYNYYWFDDTATEEQKARARREAPKASKQQQVSGPIQRAKRVSVRGTPHLVVSIKHGDQDVAVDLGTAETLDALNLQLGDRITVMGMKTKVGEKSIVLAQTIKADGETRRIDRRRRELQGKIVDTRESTIRNSRHLIAMVNTEQGKLAVDLGPAEKLGIDLKKGQELTFTGVPVKVKDRRFVMAQTVQHDGETMQIDRTRKTSKQ